jgi:hypothetical protein
LSGIRRQNSEFRKGIENENDDEDEDD